MDPVQEFHGKVAAIKALFSFAGGNLKLLDTCNGRVVK